MCWSHGEEVSLVEPMPVDSKDEEIPVPEGAPWFDHICQSRVTHSILKQVETALISRPFGPEKTYAQLGRLDAAFESPKCALICALAIQTLKKASFLDLPEGLNKTCLNLVNSIWHKGRHCRDADAVLNPDKFLTGWKEDIPRVRPEVLGTYVRILSCEGAHSSNEFAAAVDALCEFVKGGNLHPYVQDAVADAFIGEVLDTLAEKDLQRVLQFMEKGAELATSSAAAGGDAQGLWDLDVITERIVSRPMNDELSKSRIETFEAIYKRLNSMYKDISLCDDEKTKAIRRNVEPYLASTIPRVQFRPTRPPRQRSDGCIATVRAVIDRSETKEWTGDVIDLCSQGHGVHIRFHNNVIKCEAAHASEQLIPGTNVKSIKLLIKEKSESQWGFRQATLALCFPPGFGSGPSNHEAKCDAWAIRGWNYLGKENEAGALFWLAQEPTELIPYRQNLPRRLGDQIPAGSGSVERTPEAAPIRRQLAKEDLGFPFTGPESILEGIKKWFADWAEDIRVHERWPILWPHGKPTDERSIDSLVRGDLQKYVESRGGHFSVHDSSGLGLVDYSVPFGKNEVVVELKLGHAKWKQGIDAQLATYMKAKDTRYGVFVVFDFAQEFGKDSERLNDLVKRQGTVCGNEGIRIDIAIISCDKPMPGSERNRPPRPGEGFEWYAGPSPHK